MHRAHPVDGLGSLLALSNSLFASNKFPVPVCREFFGKALALPGILRVPLPAEARILSISL
jgi:hypothetical protein